MESLFTKQIFVVLAIVGLIGYSIKLGRANNSQSERLSFLEEKLRTLQPNQNMNSTGDPGSLQQTIEKIENRLSLLERKSNVGIPGGAPLPNSLASSPTSQKSPTQNGGGGIEVQLNNGSTLCKEVTGSANCSSDRKTLICPANTSKKFIRDGYSEKYKSKKKVYACEPN